MKSTRICRSLASMLGVSVLRKVLLKIGGAVVHGCKTLPGATGCLSLLAPDWLISPRPIPHPIGPRMTYDVRVRGRLRSQSCHNYSLRV